MLRSMTIHNSLFSRRTFVVGSIIPLIAGCSSKNTVENAAETRFIARPIATMLHQLLPWTPPNLQSRRCRKTQSLNPTRGKISSTV